MLCRLNHDENPPMGEPQVCKKCHEPLPARWFALHPTRLNGRKGSCLACSAAYKRALSCRKHQSLRRKECRRCHQILDAACFSRKSASADGLQGICKGCASTQFRDHKQALIRVAVPSKRCCNCGVEKPAASFSAYSKTVDGLDATCKDCKARRRRASRRQQRTAMQDEAAQPHYTGVVPQARLLCLCVVASLKPA